MMKKINLLMFLYLAIVLFGACSNDEDVSPSFADANKFAPIAEDQSEEASLRRSFYEKNKCYLLFNDTLRKVQTGVDEQGHPLYELKLLDITYDMFSSSATDYYRYTYDYISSIEDKRKAAKLVEDNLIRRLGTNTPFSVLLVNKMTSWKSRDGEWQQKSNLNYYMGSQCYVISLSEGEAFDNPSYFSDILQKIVLAKVKLKGDSFLKDFYALVDNYDNLTSGWYYKDDLGYPLGYDDDLARSLGFMRDGSKWSFRYKEYDVSDFVTAVFTYSQEEFEETFADYPICIARFNKMKELIESMGIIVDE